MRTIIELCRLLVIIIRLLLRGVAAGIVGLDIVLEWIERRLSPYPSQSPLQGERENNFDPAIASVREIQQHFRISHRQAYEKYQSYHSPAPAY